MRQGRYEDMIFAATSLPQEVPTLERFLRWFSPAFAAAFLFVALVNVEPHDQLTESTIVVSNESMMRSTSTTDEVFGTEVQSFDTADDYLLLSSLEF